MSPVAHDCQNLSQSLYYEVASIISKIPVFKPLTNIMPLLMFLYKVLMTAKFPFKLGARVLRFLYDNFLFHDFSLQNFARGLQVS